MSNEELAILITLVAYKLLLLTIGFLAERRTKDKTDLYLGGRRLGPLVAAISASASSSSAWTLLGVSGAAYKFGLSAIWLFPACVGGFALNWFVVAPRLRRQSAANGSMTLIEFLAGGRRDNDPGRRAVTIIASVIVLSCLIIYVASQFSGAGKSFDAIFQHLDGTTAVAIGAAIVIIYTMAGGFWAVSLTDTLQGLVMAVTAIMLPIGALVQVGGFGALSNHLASVDDAYTHWFAGAAPVTGIGLVLGYLGIGLGYPGQPHVVNRFMALRDDRAVARARLYSMVWAVLVYAGMILLGLCGKVLVASLGDNEQLLLTVSQGVFPPIVTGIMLAAVLSAMMSTTDSQLLVAASTVSYDLGAARDGHKGLFRDRMVILLVSIFALLLALLGEQSIFDRVLFAWTGMGAAFGPVLLYRLYRGPVTAMATIATMVVGAGSASFFAEWTGEPWVWTAGFDRRFLPFILSTMTLFTLNKKVG